MSDVSARDVGLANTLLNELEMSPTNSAIVSLPLAEDFDRNRLSDLAVAYRAGRLRVGFHLYNTLDDVAAVVAAVSGAVLHT